MKLKFSTALIGLIILAASCSKSLDNNTSDIAASGTWRVTLFTNSGTDETADFTGYTFTFSSNGTVAALKSGITQNGTWSVDNSSGKFIINLGPKDNSNKPLGELTDDWKIISSSNSEIKLKDDSNNELLTFGKN